MFVDSQTVMPDIESFDFDNDGAALRRHLSCPDCRPRHGH